ncbi:MAG: tetratricopeptide repeat protein, partial [Gammaproteobacteria bacterium]|nr:tetratricopeptide repeat protein [Gammaproteobacteria bacterium]
AAELYARAGRRQRAVDLYNSFSSERPGHALVPRALLRVGQLNQAMGRLTEAIESYQTCYRRFPRTLDGARTLVPLAECYLALGPGNESLAEATLRIVTATSDVFTPQAPEFTDAAFLLGDVLSRVNEFERAIAVMEETLERFADDSRAGRTRFLLADAYRRSALALKLESADASFAGEIQQMQIEAASRFRHARDLYRRIIDEYESRGAESLGRLEKVYYRHATLYEADCHFETQDYRQALKLYEEAAAIFKDSPTGLAAYVQIINCHVFLGRPHEARAALARAEILVDSMSDAAFEGSVSPERREDWKRYLGWLNETELF